MIEQKRWKRSHRDVDLYFEGYERQDAVDPITGKRRTEYRYTGDYYLFRLEPEQFSRYRLISALLTLGGTAAFVTANVLGPQGSVKNYAGLPALVSLIPLCYLLMGLWGLVRSGSPKMTIRDYVFGIGRMKNTLWAVILLWVAALLGQMIYMIFSRDLSLLELGCSGLELLAVALLIIQWRLQERVLSACIHRAESKFDTDEENVQEGGSYNG